MLRGAGEQLPLLFIDHDTSSQQRPGWGSSSSSRSRSSSASAAPATTHSLVRRHYIPAIVAYYSLCSSTLIVINKVAVHNLAAPVFILVLQLLFAAAVVNALALAGAVQADALQWRLVRPFLPFIASFLGTIFANIKVLEHSNVETFITFRSSTPLVLSLAESALLGRELPRGRSVAGMVLPLVACAGYTYFNAGFKVQGYAWLGVWYAFFLFDALYVKYMCDTVPMTDWGRVYYTNLISGLAMAAVLPFCRAEHRALRAFGLAQPRHATLLLLSCLVGVGMSHVTFLTRAAVSATAGVVIGVVCKLGSVLLNLAIWEQHGTPVQIFFLLLGLVGGSMLQQAPMRRNWRYDQNNSSSSSNNNTNTSKQAAPAGSLGDAGAGASAAAPDLESSSPSGDGAGGAAGAGPRGLIGLDGAATRGSGGVLSGASAAQAGALADLQQLSLWMRGYAAVPGVWTPGKN